MSVMYSDDTKEFHFDVLINDQNEIELTIKNKNGSEIKINSNEVNFGTLYYLKIIQHLFAEINSEKNYNCFEL